MSRTCTFCTFNNSYVCSGDFCMLCQNCIDAEAESNNQGSLDSSPKVKDTEHKIPALH